MRTFLNGAGADVSTSTYNFLKANNALRLANLVLIGELEDPLAEFLTDWETDLTWSLYGNFQRTVFQRDKITSKVGLEVATFNFEWSPQITAAGIDLATATPYQKAYSGFYDNRTFRLWRSVLSAGGDANTHGACSLFGGRVGDVKIEVGKITFTINSFLDVINQQVPPNVIELNNTAANFAGNTPVVADGETQLPQFSVVAHSTQSNIIAACLSPTLNKIYSVNKFQYGYIVFNQSSSLAGYWSPVALSGTYNDSGTHYNQFILYAPFPWAPAPGDTFYASTQPPINLQDAALGFAYFGFPYVPQPESAA